MALQPVDTRLIPIRWNGWSQRHHGAADAQLVGETQTVSPKKCQPGMQRSRQGRRRNHRCASSRLEECQSLIPANLVLYSRAPVEIDQVRAAAQQHMLAVVDHLSGSGMLIRRCAPAKIRPAFEERHAKSRFRQGAARGQASQSASGYGDCRRMWGIGHNRRFTVPFPRTVSFSGMVNRTRSLNTSYWFAAIFSSRRR